MQDQVFNVSGMFHDGFVSLKKYYGLYGHVTRARKRYFPGNLLEKVNAKKIDSAIIAN
jgi:hypothetical protein